MKTKHRDISLHPPDITQFWENFHLYSWERPGQIDKQLRPSPKQMDKLGWPWERVETQAREGGRTALRH